MSSQILKFTCAFALLGSMFLSVAPAFADSVPDGRVVVARLGGSPLIIWDASSSIHELPANPAQRQSLDRKLAAGALSIIRSKSSLLEHAHEATIRIVYTAVASDNQQYGAPTFTGLKPILVVKAKLPQSTQSISEWQQSLNRGITPSGLSITDAN